MLSFLVGTAAVLIIAQILGLVEYVVGFAIILAVLALTTVAGALLGVALDVPDNAIMLLAGLGFLAPILCVLIYYQDR